MARRRHSNRRRRRGNFGFLYKLLSVLVICAAVVMALTLFFRVDTIEVTGTERYTEKDVIEASGIQLGDNLFLLNKYEAARSIAEQLPYIDIEDIRIRQDQPDAGPHADQFVHMAIAVFKDVLLKYRGASAAQQCRHQHRLRVRWKAGVGRRLHRPHGPQPLPAQSPDASAVCRDRAARLPQGGGDCGQVPLLRAPEIDVPAGRGRRAEVSSRRDPIRHDPVRTAVEVLPALYGHGGAPRPGHPSPAGVQEVLQVHHLRLPGGVGDHRHAIGAAGRQHGILGGSYAGDRQDDLPSSKVVSTAVETAALTFYLSAHGGQCRQVQIDGSGA